MNLAEELNRKMTLEKPTTVTAFEVIRTSDDEDSSSTWSSEKSERSYKIISRNPDLFLPPEMLPTDQISFNEGPNEYDISASIIESNGGRPSSSITEYERWVRITRENEARKIAKEEEVEKEKLKLKLREEAENIKALEKRKKRYKYKNNVLMRELVEQKLAKGEIPGELVESTSEGKNEDYCNNITNGVLVQSIDDPNYFYLRDTSAMNSHVSDDGYRFEHRGVKKKVTSRDYALYEIPDEYFKFEKRTK